MKRASILALSLWLAACGNKEGATSTSEGSSGAEGTTATAEGTAAPAAGQPAFLRSHHVNFDLLEHAHLADVDHGGTYIDFGTPARMKYTVGQWRTGWFGDRSANGTTFTNSSNASRVYFNVERQGPLTIRLRMRAIGTRRLTPYMNNTALTTLTLDEGNEFKDYDITVPAENVVAGENNLLLRFGGSTSIGGEDQSAAVDSIRIVEGTIAPGSYSPPLFGELVTEVRSGGVQRRALAVQTPTRLSWYVEVPAGAKLGFGVGIEGDAAANATAKVVVTAEGGSPRELFSQAVAKRWNDQTVDLGEFAGKVVRVDLITEGTGGAGRVGWSAPSILVPNPAAAAQARPAKNAIVLLIDTMRADHLKPWNARTRVRTPAIETFAREGMVFQNAQSPENWTKPSVASVLTSLWPMTHRAKTDEARLSASAVMISEVFKEAGFATASFIANGYVSDRFGFAQGWDHYTNFIRENKNTNAENLFREAGDWIEQHKNERFFAYVHTIDPHVPYDPPAEYLRMYDPGEYAGQVQPRLTADQLEKAKRNPPIVTFDQRDRQRLEALYDGEVSYHDHELGAFIERLKRLGVYDDTVFLITADHGEEFNDHGSYGHGHSVYQELLHVPLAVRYPGRVQAGGNVTTTVSTVDVMPTVLGLTGTNVPQAAEGHTLEPFFGSALRDGPQVAFSDFLDDRRVIRAGRWKLILRGLNSTLFDLEADPGEQREVALQSRPIATRYCRILLGQFLGARDRRNWLGANQTERSQQLREENADIDPTLRGQLEALGYAGGGNKAPAPAPTAPR